MTETVLRFDTSKLGKANITDEGFIRADAIVTRTGIFLYQNPDGTLRRELRHPDEVFKADSLKSMHMIPITNGHPPDRLVTAKNAKQLSIGHVGQDVKQDNQFVIAPIAITTDDGVNAVKNGRKELSLGYTADMDDTPGIYEGQRYDARQTNIRYNHLSIVDKARAGAAARINLDSSDAVQIEDENKEENSMNLEKVIIDGITYDAAPEVKNALAKAKQKLDELEPKVTSLSAQVETVKNDLDKTTAEKDALKEKLDALEAKDNSAEIAAAVKARVQLVDSAKPILAKEKLAKLDDMSDLEIKKEVVLAVSPKAKLDGQSDVYIQARFDAALEASASRVSINDSNKHLLGNVAEGAAHTDAASARAKMIERNKNAYKQGESK